MDPVLNLGSKTLEVKRVALNLWAETVAGVLSVPGAEIVPPEGCAQATRNDNSGKKSKG